MSYLKRLSKWLFDKYYTLLMIFVIIALLAGIATAIPIRNCALIGEKYGYNHQMTVTGCMLEISPGKWIPAAYFTPEGK